MSAEEWTETLRPWLREAYAPAFEAALDWLWPRCRTEEERSLAPALLLLLSPLNALVAPCRPVAGSCVNFQVTMSRLDGDGAERVRLTVRAGNKGVQDAARPDPEHPNTRIPEHLTVWLDASEVSADPLDCAARVLERLLR